MYDQRALAQYRQTQVMTATPAKLVFMTYSALNRSLEAARAAHESQNWERFRERLLHAQEIVNELQVALNLEEGGEIAGNLWSLYNFIRRRLIQANISRSLEPLDEVQPIVNDLLEAWAELSHA